VISRTRTQHLQMIVTFMSMFGVFYFTHTQMIHVEHHQLFHAPGARSEEQGGEGGEGLQSGAQDGLHAAVSPHGDASSTTSSTVTAASSRPASATPSAASGGGLPGSGGQRTATEASAAASAKEALMCALNLQALEQLVALGEEGVCSWEDIEDDFDFNALAWVHVQGVVQKTRTPLVILSLLDREGTLVAWIVPAEAERGTKSVKMVLMEKRPELCALVRSWADVPALLSTMRRPRQGSDARPPPPSHAPAAAAGEHERDTEESGGNEGGGEESNVLRVLYDVCWKDIAALVQSWQHVRLVVHGELLLVPWGDLQDSTGSRLADRHIISVEPCLKGLINLLDNLAPDSAAAGRAGSAVAGLRVDQALGSLRVGAPDGTGLVVAAPRSMRDEQDSWMHVSAQERRDHCQEAEEDKLMAASLAPLPRPAPPAGSNGAGGGLAQSQDAVQEGLDNPPPGGWLPRGQAAAPGAGAHAPSGGGSSSCGDGGEDSTSARPPAAVAASRDADRDAEAREREAELGEKVELGEDAMEASAVVASLKAVGMQVSARRAGQGGARGRRETFGVIGERHFVSSSYFAITVSLCWETKCVGTRARACLSCMRCMETRRSRRLRATTGGCAGQSAVRRVRLSQCGASGLSARAVDSLRWSLPPQVLVYHSLARLCTRALSR